MDDQLQCCDKCTSPAWIFVINGEPVAICQSCSMRPELKQTAKQAWNVSTGRFDNEFLKLEIVA